MKKKSVGNTIATIIVILAIIGGIGYYLYQKKLDGRECLDCPYKSELKKADFDYESKIVNTSYDTAKVKVTIATAHTSLKIDGSIDVRVTCTFNYGFSGAYGMKSSRESFATKNIKFKKSSKEEETFTVKAISAPNSIYNYRSSTKCTTEIVKTYGSFLIYGERVK